MWRFIAAQAIGTSHLKAAFPCQDKLACEVLADGSLVAAVADGAGSAPMAERGADIAVNTVIEHLKHGLKEKRTDFERLLRESASLAREAISVDALREGIILQNYASTLLAAVLTPHGGGALQIGDGIIVVGEGNDEWYWVFWPQRGEYVNTTHFLTDENASKQLEVEVFSGFVVDIALLSDGLEPLALHYASKTVYNPFFRSTFAPLLKAEGHGEITALSNFLEKFLSSDQIRSRTDDDVSFVLATRRKHKKFDDEF